MYVNSHIDNRYQIAQTMLFFYLCTNKYITITLWQKNDLREQNFLFSANYALYGLILKRK